MLRIITGRAGAGKTSGIMEELRADIAAGLAGRLLLVPEQFSHEAERELAHAAGPGLALCAEVLSFTGLARRLEAEAGPGGRSALTAGGRLLCMALAVDNVCTSLRVYARARRSPEMQLELLGALDELTAAEIGPARLMEAAERAPGVLGDKLRDLALLSEAFAAAVGSERLDPGGSLDLAAERLERSDFARGGVVYIDGFTDFTAQEKRIIELLLGRADVTVCLTLDDIDGGSELFDLARSTARWLMRRAREEGMACRVETAGAGERSPMDVLADNLLAYPAREFDAAGRISLHTAPQIADECAFAAAKTLELARSGCRWRDIAVAVRGFEDYRCALEAAFARCGVPLFVSRQVDIMQKPLPTLISAAYEAVLGGWEAAEVFAYLRGGLAGLSEDECDELENYCFTWDIASRRWHSEGEWTMHPDGWGGKYDEAARARLERINSLRYRAAGPLLEFEAAVRGANTAREHCAALAGLFAALELPVKLAERAAELESAGRRQAAAEYSRVWDAAVDALEQCCAIMGGMEIEGADFARLYLLTLSQYNVGVIPVSLDMAAAGDLERMRRRHIKHLIILGADEGRLPAPGPEGGVFSADERRALAGLGVELDAGDAELWREYTLIYNSVTLPSETLTITSPLFASDGSAREPGLLMRRAAGLFGLKITPVDRAGALLASENTAVDLAASALAGDDSAPAQAALRYFRRADPGRLERIRSAAAIGRGRLSRESAIGLYGRDLRLSASRIERFANCRFSYFMNYGMRAKPRAKAEFKAPEAGTFIHYILQNCAAAAPEGNIAALTDERLDALTREYSARYLEENLGGREGKKARFLYLFDRLAASAERIVRDMAGELRGSDFRPIALELDISRAAPGAAIPLAGGGSVRPAGIADRVDGWIHNGRLYLRVVDYKTGRKSFSLSDVYYGLNMQMLLYLFTLAGEGERLYGRETVPAGVLYIPARDELVQKDADLPDAELAKERIKSLRRSGLILDDPDVLRAMEHEGSPERLPVKWSDGRAGGDALASAERLGALARHVEDTLRAMAGEIRAGSIEADPCWKDAQENACLWCDYASACRFADGEGGDRRRYLPKLKASQVWEMMEGAEEDG